jgi:hypothetical protein
MAEYAARNWGRTDVQKILLAMGMDQKTIDSLQGKTHQQIKATMLAQFMRR